MSSPSTPQYALGPRAGQSPILSELVRQLEEFVVATDEGRPLPQDDPSLVSWQDEENLYLESELAGENHVEADVSILEGKVVIRIRKPEHNEGVEPDADDGNDRPDLPAGPDSLGSSRHF